MPDDDFDFEANEEKLGGDTKADSDVTADDSGSVVDEYLDDDEAYMGDEDVDLDDLSDDEEPDEEEDEDTVKKGDEEEDTKIDGDKKTTDTEEDPYSKIREDILSRVEDDTILKIKGKELRAGDLSKEELVMHLQKGIRADDLFNEVADMRRQLEQERALVSKGAQAVQQLIDQQGSPQKSQDPALTQVLEKLKVDEFNDTPTEKTLKVLASELVQEVDTLRRDVQQGKVHTYESEVVGEIRTLKKQFPLASVDEVLAVKTSHPDASLERLMEAGHNYYASLDFVKESLSNNPQAKREYDDEVIRNYNAQKGKTKNVPLRRSRTSGSEKVSTKARPKMGFNYDFDNAEALGMEYLKEVAKSNG